MYIISRDKQKMVKLKGGREMYIVSQNRKFMVKLDEGMFIHKESKTGKYEVRVKTPNGVVIVAEYRTECQAIKTLVDLGKSYSNEQKVSAIKQVDENDQMLEEKDESWVKELESQEGFIQKNLAHRNCMKCVYHNSPCTRFENPLLGICGVFEPKEEK